MEWPLIETAPKDGTEIVVFEWATPSEWARPIYPNGLPYCAVVSWVGGCRWSDGTSSGPDINPTHWMPLPPQPGEQGEM
jgi:hypothetical protein